MILTNLGGGSGYNGPTVCPSGWKCTFTNEFYSQCEFPFHFKLMENTLTVFAGV